ncbi:MAG: hypothetical protein VCA37_07405, partial [Roseibacillus sp.]
PRKQFTRENPHLEPSTCCDRSSRLWLREHRLDLEDMMFLSVAYWAAFATHDGALFYLIGMGLLGAALVGAIIGKESLDYPTGCL